MLDRIDIHIEVLRVAYNKLSSELLGESSAVIRAGVRLPNSIMVSGLREQILSVILTCVLLKYAEVRKYCKLDETGDSLRTAMSQLDLTARAYHRILKLARTIADLAESEHIQTPHLT